MPTILLAAARLAKMAIRDLPPGKRFTPDDSDRYGDIPVYDYSHLLDDDQRAAGYSLRVPGSSFPGGYFSADIHHGSNIVGRVQGRRPSSPAELETHSSLGPSHRGKGLARAAYEALFVHGLHVEGVRRVKGEGNSLEAANVHQRLAQKHGLAYAPAYVGGAYAYDLDSSEPNRPAGPGWPARKR